MWKKEENDDTDLVRELSNSRATLQRTRERGSKEALPTGGLEAYSCMMERREVQNTALRRIMSWVKTKVCSPMNLAPDWTKTSRLERFALTASIRSLQKGLTKLARESLFWGS